jgi:hypothetical protein
MLSVQGKDFVRGLVHYTAEENYENISQASRLIEPSCSKYTLAVLPLHPLLPEYKFALLPHTQLL